MKIKFLSVIISFLVISLTITSCLDNENNIEYGTDPTIHSFSINDINTDSIIKNGNYNGTKDTTIVLKVTGSKYPFTIDQLSGGTYTYQEGSESKTITYTGRIFNNDSLPIGTNIKKVVVNMGITSYITYNRKNIEGKDSLCLWMSTDSLDFTNPIYFSVYAQDPTLAPKIYQAKINVHKQHPDSLQWSKMNANFPVIVGKQKAIYINENIYIFANTASGIYIAKSANGTSWGEISISNSSLPANADYSSVVAYLNKLFIVAGGKVYSSNDGSIWSEISNLTGVTTLISAFNSNNNKRLIGIKGTKFIQTIDGLTWEETVALPEGFPQKNFSVAPAYPIKTNSKLEKMILISNEPKASVSDTASVVWSLSSEKNSWELYSPQTGDKYTCPLFNNISIIRYNEQLYSFGGASKGLKAFQSFYASKDEGLNWKEETRLIRFPKEFLDRGDNFSYIVDKDNFLWIMWSNSGEVWRGRINKLGFAKKQ